MQPHCVPTTISTYQAAVCTGVSLTWQHMSAGGLLDEGAARAALDSGTLGGLGLDVQSDEPIDPGGWLANHPRVVLTPHVAGVTELSYRTMAGVVAREARRARDGLPPTVQLSSVAREGLP